MPPKVQQTNPWVQRFRNVMNISQNRFIVILFVTSVLAISIIIISNSALYRMFIAKESEHQKPPIVPYARTKSYVEKSAYVFLGLGAQAHQRNCPAAIESLVKHAGWAGDVYLITDKPNCFNKTRVIKEAGIEASKMHFVVPNDEKFGGGRINLRNPEMALKTDRMLAKGMKTKIFDFIDERIDQVAFVDCDVIFGIEGCAARLFEAGEPWREGVNIKLRKVRRDETGRLTDVHLGMFVAHRKYSQKFMEGWGEAIRSLKYPLDKLAFFGAYNEKVDELLRDKKITASAVHNPTLNYMEPSIIEVPEYALEKFIDLSLPPEQQISCINHITKERCASDGREKVREYVQRFNLVNYKNNQHYCVHPWVMPFLYGWLPLDKFSTCPKFENIL